MYLDESLKSFTFGREIWNKFNNMGYITYAGSELYYLAVLNGCFCIGTNNNIR
jgi:hypothetical protein